MSATAKPPTKSLPSANKTIRNIVSLVPLITVLSFVLSVTYDFGFFIIFGITFDELPTTLSDHIRTGLIFLPYVFLYFFIVFITELFFIRIEQGRTEEEIIEEASNPKFIRRFKIAPLFSIFIFSVLVILIGLMLYEEDPYLVYLPLCALMAPWIFLVNFLFNHDNANRSLYPFRRYIIWGPMILIFTFFYGIYDATRIKNEQNDKQYIFEINNEQIKAVLVRSFERYHLVWNKKEQRIKFLMVDKVEQFYPATALNEKTIIKLR